MARLIEQVVDWPAASLNEGEATELICELLIDYYGDRPKGLLGEIAADLLEAAMGYAVEQGATVNNLVDDLGPAGLSVLSEVCSGLRAADATSYRDELNWIHSITIERDVKSSRAPIMVHEFLIGATSDYLALPYRSAKLDRLLVDVLMALEIYSFMDVMFGSLAHSAKPLDEGILGTSGISLVARNPGWKVVRLVRYLSGSLLCIAVACWLLPPSAISPEAKAWLVFPTSILGAIAALSSVYFARIAWTIEHEKNITIIMVISDMIRTYSLLETDCELSPSRLKQRLLASEERNIRWPPPLYQLLEDCILGNRKIGRLRSIYPSRITD